MVFEMKYLNKIPAWIFLSLIIYSCSSGDIEKQQNPKNNPKAPSRADYAVVANARNTLNWAGTYQGIFPCSRCEGTAMMITLSRDLSYSLRTRRLGIDNMDRKENGKFSWTDSSHIRLGGQQPLTFRVGDDFLEQTLNNGKDMGIKYILEKTD